MGIHEQAGGIGHDNDTGSHLCRARHSCYSLALGAFADSVAGQGRKIKEKRIATAMETLALVYQTRHTPFAERDLWNIGRVVILFRLDVGRADDFAPLFGFVGDASRVFSLGSARAALISLLSLSMISEGVFLGAPTPNQPLAS